MKYVFGPKEPLICSICGEHMGSTSVITYFSAYCKNNHRHEGVVSEGKIFAGREGTYKVTVVTVRKRLGNRRAKIKYYPPPLDEYEVALVVQDPKRYLSDRYLCCIKMTPEEYKKYENDNTALRKRLEIAEVFK